MATRLWLTTLVARNAIIQVTLEEDESYDILPFKDAEAEKILRT